MSILYYLESTVKKQSCVGDDVWYPACQSMGKIAPDQDRLSTKVGGRMPALNDDLCLCLCSPPPKLVNSQTNFREIIENEQIALNNPSRRINTESDDYIIYFQFVDKLGAVFANKEYFAMNGKGDFLEGITDSNGFIEPIFTKKSENFTFHLIDNFLEGSSNE